MPIYVKTCRVDWRWAERSPAEREAIRGFERELDGGDHGLDSVAEVLARASAALPAIEVRALIEDDTRSRTLLLATAGHVQTVAVQDALQRGPWAQLPWLSLDRVAVRCEAADQVADALSGASDEDILGEEDEIELPLEYTSESGLRGAMDVVAASMISEPDSFIASVDERRFLVRLAPGKVDVAPLVAWPNTDDERHAAVVEVLLGAGGDDVVPDDAPVVERSYGAADKVEKALFFRDATLDEMRIDAARIDRSLSWVAQYAWKHARVHIAGAADRDAVAAGPPQETGGIQRQTLFFPGDMLQEIEHEAARLDVSASWLVQQALWHARGAIAALPDDPA